MVQQSIRVMVTFQPPKPPGLTPTPGPSQKIRVHLCIVLHTTLAQLSSHLLVAAALLSAGRMAGLIKSHV